MMMVAMLVTAHGCRKYSSERSQRLGQHRRRATVPADRTVNGRVIWATRVQQMEPSLNLRTIYIRDRWEVFFSSSSSSPLVARSSLSKDQSSLSAPFLTRLLICLCHDEERRVKTECMHGFFSSSSGTV